MSVFEYKIAPIAPDLVQHLERSLESVPHVQAVYVDLQDSRVILEHDGADTEEIFAVLRDEGVVT